MCSVFYCACFVAGLLGFAVFAVTVCCMDQLAVFSSEIALDVTRFRPVVNRAHSKPSGGVWLSGLDVTWKDWCTDNMFSRPDTFEEFVYRFPSGLRVARVDCAADFDQLFSLVGSDPGAADLAASIEQYAPGSSGMFDRLLNFERLAELFDCLHVTDSGVFDPGLRYGSLWGYDLESFLLLNVEAVSSLEFVGLRADLFRSSRVVLPVRGSAAGDLRRSGLGF